MATTEPANEADFRISSKSLPTVPRPAERLGQQRTGARDELAEDLQPRRHLPQRLAQRHIAHRCDGDLARLGEGAGDVEDSAEATLGADALPQRAW